MTAHADLERAQGYLDAGHLTSAAATFTEVLTAADTDRINRAAALVGLGRVVLARGDVVRARLYAGEALAHDSVCRPARQLMADLATRAGATEEAAAWQREAR